MRATLRSLLSAPRVAREELQPAASLLQDILLITLIGNLIYLPVLALVLDDPWPGLAGNGVMLVIQVALFLWNRRGGVLRAGVVFLLVLWVYVTAVLIWYGGSRSPAVNGYFLVLLTAALLASRRWTLIVAALSLLGTTLIFLLEWGGQLPASVVAISPAYVWTGVLMILVVEAALLFVVINRLNESLERSRREIGERQRTEAELRRSRQRYVDLFENVPIPLWVEDFSAVRRRLMGLQRDGVADLESHLLAHPELVRQCAAEIQVVDVNRATLHMYEAPDKQALLTNLETILEDRALADFARQLAAMAAGRKRWETDSYNRSLSGRGMNIRVTWAVEPAHEDDWSRVYVTTADITRSKVAEAALRASEERFRALIEHATDGIVVTDREGRIASINPAAVRLAGHERDDIIGQAVTVLFDAAELGRRPFRVDAIRAGRTLIEPRHVRRPDGSLVPVEISARMLPDGRIQGLVRDMTERLRAESQIKQRNRELEALLEVSRQLTARLIALPELLQTVVASVVETLPPAEAATLWLAREGGARLEIVAAAGPYADVGVRGTTVTRGEGLVSQVFLSRRPEIFNDASAEPGYILLAPPMLNQIRAMIGVPLIVADQVIGVLFADNLSRPGAFAAEDQRWLESLAGQMAVVIQSARLFDQVQSARGRLEAMSRRLVEVQEQERRHLALELHDQVGQSLTAVRLGLQGLAGSVTGEAGQEKLARLLDSTRSVVDQVRQLSLDLRPPMLDDLGLMAALRWYLNRLAEETGLVVDLKMETFTIRPEPVVETACFRIVQEAATNTARHARPTCIEVVIRQQVDQLTLTVRDDGQGFDVAQAWDQVRRGASLGLLSMRERAELVGGRLEIVSSSGRGTVIEARIPTAGGGAVSNSGVDQSGGS